MRASVWTCPFRLVNSLYEADFATPQKWAAPGPPQFSHWPGVQTRTWSPQSIAAVRREGMTVGSHPSPTAPEADIKTFPSPPPHYRKNRRLYKGICFRKFPKFSGTKIQNVRTGVLGFLTPPRVREKIPGLITWRYTQLVLIPAQRWLGPLR